MGVVTFSETDWEDDVANRSGFEGRTSETVDLTFMTKFFTLPKKYSRLNPLFV